MGLADVIRMARGDEPADLVLRNAQLVNVFSGEIEATDIAIGGEQIVGLGRGYEAGRPSISGVPTWRRASSTPTSTSKAR